MTEPAVGLRIQRGMTRLLAVPALLVVLGLPAAASGFDGRWSVELITRQGGCDPSFRIPVQVADGRLAAVAGAEVTSFGAIDGRGRVTLQLSRGAETLSAQGRVQGGAGQGVWSLPARNCSGVWRANRMRPLS